MVAGRDTKIGKTWTLACKELIWCVAIPFLLVF